VIACSIQNYNNHISDILFITTKRQNVDDYSNKKGKIKHGTILN
jgi:hypothetical protein